MADFAQLMYGTASDVNKSEGAGFQQAVQGGAELALKAEQNKIQQAQLQAKLAELQDAKVNKLYDMMNNVSKYSPAARNNFLKSVTNMRDALGLKGIINDNSIQALKYDDNMGRAATLQSMVQNRLITPQQAIEKMNDPNSFADTPITAAELASNEQNMFEGAKQANQLNSEEWKTKYVQNMETQRAREAVQMTPLKASGEEAGKSYQKFMDEGGLGAQEVRLQRLQRVRDQLASGQLDTRTFSSALEHWAKHGDLSAFNPQIQAAMEDVRNGLNLTSQIGGRLSQQEFQVLTAQAFNPLLPKEANIQKLNDQMQSQIANTNNQLRGYSARGLNVPGAQDWLQKKAQGAGFELTPTGAVPKQQLGGQNQPQQQAPPSVQNLSPQIKQSVKAEFTKPGALEYWSNYFNMSPAQLQSALGQ